MNVMLLEHTQKDDAAENVDQSSEALERLAAAVTAARIDADSFEKVMIKKSNEAKCNGDQELQELEECLQELVKRVNSQRNQGRKYTELKEMENSVEALENETETLEITIRSLAKQRKEIIQEEKNTTKNLDSLELYRKLGLDLEPDGTSSLRLSFRLLDPKEAHRCFYATLAVDHNDKYFLPAPTKPALPTRLLDSLILHLNNTNDFGSFAVSLRKLFATHFVSQTSGSNYSNNSIPHTDLGPPTPLRQDTCSYPRSPSPPPPPLDSL